MNNVNNNSNNNNNNILQPSAHTHQNKDKGLVRDFEGKTAFRKIF